MTLLWQARPGDGPAYFKAFAAHQGAQLAAGDDHDAITLVEHAGRHAAKITVHDTDTESLSSLSNHSYPAAALLTAPMFARGDDRFIRWSILFPADFPLVKTWLQVGEIFGAPWKGSPVLGLDVHPDDQLGWFREVTHHWDEPWKVPLARETWHDIVFHVKFSDDPTIGFVEIWHNGQGQRLWAIDPLSGKRLLGQRIYTTTLIPNMTWAPPTQRNPVGGKNAIWCDNYYQKGEFGPAGVVTVYHGDCKVGTSLADVV